MMCLSTVIKNIKASGTPVRKDARTYVEESMIIPVRDNHVVFPCHPQRLYKDLQQAVQVLGLPTRERWGPLVRLYAHALTQPFEPSCPLMKLLLYFFAVNDIPCDDLVACFLRYNSNA